MGAKAFFSRLVKRAGITFSSPWVESPDQAFWFGPMGGGSTLSGTKITRRAALGYGPFWRGVSLVSGVLAKTPLFVYRKETDGGKIRDTSHAAYKLLRRKPNPFMTAFDFKQTMTANRMIDGNSFAFIARNGGGDPVALLPLEPHSVWPTRRGGELFYQHVADGQAYEIMPSNILHFRGMGHDGMLGYNILEIARETIGAGIAMRNHGASFFRNGANPSVVLKYPNMLTPDLTKKIQDAWEKKYTGDNVHRPAVLGDNADVVVLGGKAREAQLTEQRHQEVRETANFAGCPSHMLGDPTHTSYASIEQENLAFLQYTADPLFVSFEEECYDKLLSADEKDNETHTIEFLRDSLIQPDMQTLTDTTIAEVNNGLLLLDEARGLRGRPAHVDGSGKKPRRPANIIVEGEEPPKTDSPNAPAPTGPGAGNGDDGSFAAMLAVHVRRALDRAANKARRAAKHPESFIAFVEGLATTEADIFLDNAAPTLWAMRQAGMRCNGLTRTAAELYDWIAESLCTAAECQPAGLERSIESAVSGWADEALSKSRDIIGAWR